MKETLTIAGRIVVIRTIRGLIAWLMKIAFHLDVFVRRLEAGE